MNKEFDKVISRNLRTIFLDRDGVLNKKRPEGYYITSCDEFHILPGAPEAIARLNQAGLRVLVASNQRGIALGLYTEQDVRTIHAAFQNTLKTYGAHIDAFYFCPHNKLQCNCRKPLPGLFQQAQAQFPDIDASTSAMIGDSFSDIEFGHQLGMFTVLITGGETQSKSRIEDAHAMANLCVPSLAAAVHALLAE